MDRRPYRWPRGGSAAWLGDESGAALLRSEFFGASLDLEQTANLSLAGAVTLTGDVTITVGPAGGFASPLMWVHGLGQPNSLALSQTANLSLAGAVTLTGDIGITGPSAGTGGFTSTALLWPFGFGVPVTVRNLVQTSPIGIAGSFTITGALEGTTPPAATGLVWLRRRRR